MNLGMEHQITHRKCIYTYLNQQLVINIYGPEYNHVTTKGHVVKPLPVHVSKVASTVSEIVNADLTVSSSVLIYHMTHPLQVRSGGRVANATVKRNPEFVKMRNAIVVEQAGSVTLTCAPNVMQGE
jgi:hypothetical protein